MPKISLIVVIARDNAIGYKNQLLCHLPADLKHFKQLTTGHAVVMGRHTFESLPNGPLPNRKNIVLTSKPSASTADYLEVDSLEKAFQSVADNEEIFIIGGAQIYRQYLELADLMYITWIHHSFEADTFFPEVDWNQWKEVDREDCEADEKNPYPYSFVKYERV